MRQRVPLWILLAAAFLLPACSGDREIVGPQTPVLRNHSVEDDSQEDERFSPHKDNGRLSRYAMAAS